MVKEIDWSNEFQLDSSTCGCQLYNSFGLPCACRLSLYMNVEPARQSSYTNNKQQEKKCGSFSFKFFEIDLNMQPRRHGSFSNSQGGRTHNLIPDLNEEPPASEDQFKNQKVSSHKCYD